MKSTLTALIGGVALVAGSAFACPYSEGKQMTDLDHNKDDNQSLVENAKEVDDNLFVELKREKQDTSTN